MNTKKTTITLILCLMTSLAYSTMQAPEKIIYKGKLYHAGVFNLIDKPLESYFKHKKRPLFMIGPNMLSTGNYRGYVCTWQIKNRYLYLKKIKTYVNGKKLQLRDIFGTKVTRYGVKFIWFTGRIVFHKTNRYERMINTRGKATLKKGLMLLRFKNGRLVQVLGE